ncbi:hypothetical protein NP570_24145, partial [Vibrio parahaemolyticus]|nr:hypothetical protein [Vibrio parahaemolyticus]
SLFRYGRHLIKPSSRSRGVSVNHFALFRILLLKRLASYGGALFFLEFVCELWRRSNAGLRLLICLSIRKLVEMGEVVFAQPGG